MIGVDARYRWGLVWAILRRPVLEMLAWALHILIDIPTHQGIFAVRFLWQLSNCVLDSSGCRKDSFFN